MKPLQTLAHSLLSVVLFGLLLGPMSPAFAAGPTFSPAIPEAVRIKTLQDLNLVQGLQSQGSTPVFRQIFGGQLEGTQLLTFFAKRIARFDMNDCGGGPGVAACVRPFIDSHTMWLTQNYVTFDIPQIFRISVIFHESRHTEDEHQNWFHANCPVPFKDASGNDIRGIISGSLLAGQPACDVTPYGAYGMQAELLKNVQFYCANCSEKIRMDGQIFGDDTVKRISDPRAQQVLLKDLQIQ